MTNDAHGLGLGLSRRAFLGGVGAALAAPALRSIGLGPVLQLARGDDGGRPAPLRLIFCFLPNGMHMPHWTPGKAEGDALPEKLPPILEPLAPFRDKLLVMSGLTLDGGRAHGDGPGDHARAGASFLTGAHPKKTGGADIHNGISVDQVAALGGMGKGRRFASLELGTERNRQSGSCDSGYSCAYSSNISWASPTLPVAKEIVPRRVYERLFGKGEELSPEEAARRDRWRRSILDQAASDAAALRGKLGPSDRRKLDEYTTSVRELERRLEAGEQDDQSELAEGLEVPKFVPGDYAQHIRLMHDLTRVAFQADLTRVVSFMIGNAGSNRGYRFIDVPEGHHTLSHHGKDPKKLDKIARINRWHSEQLAYLLGQLAAVKEGEGTLLDNTLIVYGSSIGDGNRHNHHDLPILLAGGGQGTVTGGRHVRYPRDTPLCNLYLSLLQRGRVNAQRFGDSTGPLPNLKV